MKMAHAPPVYPPQVGAQTLYRSAKIMVLAVPSVKFLRRLGTLSSAQMGEVEAMIKRWLGLTD